MLTIWSLPRLNFFVWSATKAWNAAIFSRWSSGRVWERVVRCLMARFFLFIKRKHQDTVPWKSSIFISSAMAFAFRRSWTVFRALHADRCSSTKASIRSSSSGQCGAWVRKAFWDFLVFFSASFCFRQSRTSFSFTPNFLCAAMFPFSSANSRTSTLNPAVYERRVATGGMVTLMPRGLCAPLLSAPEDWNVPSVKALSKHWRCKASSDWIIWFFNLIDDWFKKKYVKLYLIDWYYLNDNLIGFLIFNDFFIVKLVFCKNQITENKRVSIYNINLTFF